MLRYVCLLYTSDAADEEDSVKKSEHIRSKDNMILQPFDEYCQSVDSIFQILETAVDKYYQKVEVAQSKRPTEEW